MNCKTSYESPATLVAILVAARKIGDRDLERTMRDRLEDEHGVKLTFLRERALAAASEVSHAQ